MGLEGIEDATIEDSQLEVGQSNSIFTIAINKYGIQWYKKIMQ